MALLPFLLSTGVAKAVFGTTSSYWGLSYLETTYEEAGGIERLASDPPEREFHGQTETGISALVGYPGRTNIGLLGTLGFEGHLTYVPGFNAEDLELDFLIFGGSARATFEILPGLDLFGTLGLIYGSASAEREPASFRSEDDETGGGFGYRFSIGAQVALTDSTGITMFSETQAFEVDDPWGGDNANAFDQELQSSGIGVVRYF
ncbi:hypothetical protein HH1059_25240 [Halorhodospira halochloris]|uniref:Outer membrane protein beta-barrel domain-containing protein n=1 Tax=Halorhodospira halochloris TaxID=1052 RepID=A0A0X8X6Q6_HALHR|nr:hypothetical protein HH1059_25240 [Halorhodospira halochloris]